MYTSLDNVYLEKVKKIGVRAPWINVISEADVEQVQPEVIPVKDFFYQTLNEKNYIYIIYIRMTQ